MLIDRLFAYGLLKKGFQNFSLIEPYVITDVEAYTVGTLYKSLQTGQPLYVKEGNYKIYGTLYYIMNTKKIFSILDYVEQGHERELTTVYSNEKEHIAWIYVYKLDLKDVVLIESGVWK